LRKTFDEFKNQLNGEMPKRKLSDLNYERGTLKEYNGRQFLELLQNIDDQKSQQALITLDTKNKIVVIANSGVPFSGDGLESLMMASVSPKDKTFIGNKGLGFRSLLNWAGEIYVKSEDLSIEFSSKNRDKLQPDRKRSILSSPEWIDEKNPREWIKQIKVSDKYITYIAIHYKDNVEHRIIEQLDKVSEELLFFINHIEKIEIIKDNQKSIFHKKIWKIKTLEQLLPKEYQDEDEDIQESYQIKVILPPNNETVNPFLFSYFPTKIKIDFPALIHTTFELDASRERIIDSEKNRFIVKELANFLIKVAESFKEKNANWKTYEFVNIKHKNEILEEFGFYKIIEDWKETAEIYPCVDNQYRKKGESAFYNNEFSDFMENHSEIQGNILKRNTYIEKYILKFSKDNFTNIINQISEKDLSLEERVELIRNILIIFDDNKLKDSKFNLLINQNGKLAKQKLHFYTENIDCLPDWKKEMFYIFPELHKLLETNNLLDKLRFITYINNSQDKFKKKINNCVAGRDAESFVKKYFEQQQKDKKISEFQQVSGYAENGDDSLGYDFEYTDNQKKKHFVEVKSFKNDYFCFSNNETAVANTKKDDNYHIFLVNIEYNSICDIGNIFYNKTIFQKVVEWIQNNILKNTNKTIYYARQNDKCDNNDLTFSKGFSFTSKQYYALEKYL